MSKMPFKIKRASSVPISAVIDTVVNSNYDITFLSVRQEYLLVFDRIFPYNKKQNT